MCLTLGQRLIEADLSGLAFDVAVIAHALASLHNHLKEDDGIVLDPFKVQAYALYHDCTEIITGDLPTPIKYRKCNNC